MEQFVLLGDSITQQGSFTLVASLQEAYIRRLDIINRGLSGYNTSQALQVLEQIMPTPQQARVRLMLVFFGANDARLPNTPGPSQHVPIALFKQNLVDIIISPLVRAHDGIRLILMTPPPIDERLCEQTDRANGYDVVRRTAMSTARYALAVREVASATNTAICDVWFAFAEHAGWPGDSGSLFPGDKRLPAAGKLTELLSDGLHLSPLGYRRVFDLLMKTIKDCYPDMLPERLHMALPAWDDAEAWRAS